MKAPKFITAMALAAILGSTALPAYADFQVESGNDVNGQASVQKTDKYDPASSTSLEDQGDITINGTFNKNVNTFPTPEKPGHYLRVTMPIKMDFTYEVDSHTLSSPDMTITNNSVYLAQTPGATPEDRKVDMTLVSIEENTKGTNNIETEFVDTVSGNGSTSPTGNKTVQLPFKLDVKRGGTTFDSHNLADITVGNDIKPITIDGKSSIQLKLELIKGQKAGNTEAIDKDVSLTSHNLKLKFEYKEK